MLFTDRYDAAMQLVPELKEFENENVVILAIPRGGVPIGYYIAKAYNWPLDLMLTKKIGHPYNHELAIGSVSLEGEVIDPRFDINDAYIENEIPKLRALLQERYTLFMGNRKPSEIKNKTVIIVDDGIATGNTMLASIDVARHHQAKQIIVATPVSPPETIRKLKQKADRVICLYAPDSFMAVGQFYKKFEQVSDEEVIKILDDFSNESKKDK